MVAIRSFAEVLRRACTAELELSPDELVVDLKPYLSEEVRSAKVFIADALDNGAGYAVELGKPEVSRQLLTGGRKRLHGPIRRQRRPPDELHAFLPGLPEVVGQPALPLRVGLAAGAGHARPRRRRGTGVGPLAPLWGQGLAEEFVTGALKGKREVRVEQVRGVPVMRHESPGRW